MNQTSNMPSPAADRCRGEPERAGPSRARQRLRRRRRLPPPRASQGAYLARAEACLAAAANSLDPIARQLHEDECGLWLILARQRQAIETVLQRYVDEAGEA